MIIPSPRSKRKARIEIIPLIDIVFFLLATFVMVSLSMVKNQGMPVRLPTASTGETQGRGDEYTAVTVAEDGSVYFDKIKVVPSELPERFKALKSKEKDPMIILNGDEKADLGRVVTVLDEARKVGIKRFAISSKQP